MSELITARALAAVSLSGQRAWSRSAGVRSLDAGDIGGRNQPGGVLTSAAATEGAPASAPAPTGGEPEPSPLVAPRRATRPRPRRPPTVRRRRRVALAEGTSSRGPRAGKAAERSVPCRSGAAATLAERERATGSYPTKGQVSAEDLATVTLASHVLHGEWDYPITAIRCSRKLSRPEG